MVSPEYFRTLGILLVEGRGFQPDEMNSSEHVVVLSQQLATRLFPGENAMGKRVQFEANADLGKTDAPWCTVVGIAANVKNKGLAGEEEPGVLPASTGSRGGLGRELSPDGGFHTAGDAAAGSDVALDPCPSRDAGSDRAGQY